ncbi:hypothetical protein niasHS_002973 [Heterodera schachtii]|uniref:Domain of unknown function DB domain-containing protein n=2 Tax=Heterodera TaxID=34509 RepID=A0ABD2KA05_HETSC
MDNFKVLLFLFPLLSFITYGAILPNYQAAAKHGPNETPKFQINDLIGDKFMKCCKDNEISCSEVCTYPPPAFSFSEQWCMMTYISDFIKCYTGGHNNTKCCEDHGVVGIYGACRDFCDGTQAYTMSPSYLVCGPVTNIISKCNRDSIKHND